LGKLKYLLSSLGKASKGVPESPKNEFNQRIMLIGLCALSAVIALYFFGIMLIQSIMLVANLSVVPGILAWEKYSKFKTREKPEDSELARKRSETKNNEKRTGATKSSTEKNILASRRDILENDLRQSRWIVRESEQHNPRHVRKKISGVDFLQRSSRIQSLTKSDNKQDTADEKRNHLAELLREVKEMLLIEPRISRKFVLQPIINELNAAFKSLKRKSARSDLLGDYWACWSVLYSVSNEIPVSSVIRRFVSDDFRKRYDKFIRFIDSEKVLY